MAGSEAPPFWYKPIGLSARIASPLGWLYGAVAAWRMNTAQPTTVSAPVLCIGNMTVGGTGKTPTALALGKIALEKGLKPGFLTRGYGGSHIRPHQVDPSRDIARAVGDEPLLLARLAPTVVSQQRAQGAQVLVDRGCDFIIMDDGFQSRTVHYDFALITLDARRGIGNGMVIPAGPMRAPLLDQMRHCDAMLRIGEGDEGDQVVRAASRAAKPIMRAWLKPANVRAISRQKVLAYTGIGDPQKFYNTLSNFGCFLTETKSFGDHHMFMEKDAKMLLSMADEQELELVTTEKDFVRLGDVEGPLAELKARTHVLPVELVFDVKTDGPTLIDKVIKAYDERRIKGTN